MRPCRAAVAAVIFLTAVVAPAAVMPQARFDRLLRQAARGDEASIRAAARLRADADGARAEGIEQALSDALQTRPRQVLGLVADRPRLFPLDRLCEDRHVEPTAGSVERFVRRASAAVERVGDPALRPLRDRCLVLLGRSGSSRRG